MTGTQIFFVALSFVIIAAITAIAQFKWLNDGPVKTTLTLLSGVAVILSLRIAELPPAWFSASKTAFVLALSLTAGAFLGRTAEERSFAFPFLLGLGVTLLVANLVELVRRVL
jgi:uncharacterized membrane protein SirB2